MKRTAFFAASIALLTLGACAPLHGDDHERARLASNISGYDHGMRAVSVQTSASERAHGWRYFSDPATDRAVVISPQGDYYLSRGRGLRWVAGTPAGV